MTDQDHIKEDDSAKGFKKYGIILFLNAIYILLFYFIMKYFTG